MSMSEYAVAYLSRALVLRVTRIHSNTFRLRVFASAWAYFKITGTVSVRASMVSTLCPIWWMSLWIQLKSQKYHRCQHTAQEVCHWLSLQRTCDDKLKRMYHYEILEFAWIAYKLDERDSNQSLMIGTEDESEVEWVEPQEYSHRPIDE